jgi:hypothetical protein
MNSLQNIFLHKFLLRHAAFMKKSDNLETLSLDVVIALSLARF